MSVKFRQEICDLVTAAQLAARGNGDWEKLSKDLEDAKLRVQSLMLPLPPKVQAVVLDYKDPNAWPALRVWADTIEVAGHPELAAKVRADLEQQLPPPDLLGGP